VFTPRLAAHVRRSICLSVRDTLQEDAELFLSCVRFSSKEQLRHVDAIVRGGVNGTCDACGGAASGSGAAHGGAGTSGAGTSGASAAGGSHVLIDLIPKLRVAHPRVAVLMEHPLADARMVERLKVLPHLPHL
jgi:hypothetical protein